MSEIPIAPMGRIIKNAGGQRISEGSKEALGKVLEQWGKISPNKHFYLRNTLEE